MTTKRRTYDYMIPSTPPAWPKFDNREEPKKMKREVNRLDFKERIELLRKIEAHGKVVDGHWEYDDGWDDGAIAKQYGATVTNVGSVRVAGLAPMKNNGAGGPVYQLSQQIKALQEHNRKLEARIVALEEATTKPSERVVATHVSPHNNHVPRVRP